MICQFLKWENDEAHFMEFFPGVRKPKVVFHSFYPDESYKVARGFFEEGAFYSIVFFLNKGKTATIYHCEDDRFFYADTSEEMSIESVKAYSGAVLARNDMNDFKANMVQFFRSAYPEKSQF